MIFYIFARLLWFFFCIAMWALQLGRDADLMCKSVWQVRIEAAAIYSITVCMSTSLQRTWWSDRILLATLPIQFHCVSLTGTPLCSNELENDIKASIPEYKKKILLPCSKPDFNGNVHTCIYYTVTRFDRKALMCNFGHFLSGRSQTTLFSLVRLL